MKLLPVAGLLSILVLRAHAVCKHPSSLTDAEQAVLDKHNELRRLHKDTDDLCYGETGGDISFYAQNWAEEMAANKRMEHSTSSEYYDSNNPYGENLAYAGTSGSAPAKEVAYERSTLAWYNEISDWDFISSASTGGVTGHFTQLVWKDSQQVNCGYATFYDAPFNSYYVACQYYPAGNWVGEEPSMVAPLAGEDESNDADDEADGSDDSNVQSTLLSLNKPTSSNNNAWGGVSDRAVDGGTSGTWGDGSCTHSASSSNNWWKVDLTQTARVDTIKIYNRLDCCSDRINGVKVYVGDELCGEIVYSARQAVYTLECGGMAGDWVKVVQASNVLTLCEVQVYGKSEDDSSLDDNSSDDNSSDDSSSGDSSSEPSSCEPQYYARKGNLQIITSPGYPDKYPNNEDMCMSAISAGAGQQVRLVFTEFALQFGYGCPYNPCPYDYVEIKDGDSASAPLIGRYCGDDSPGIITSQNGALYLDFYSNGNKRAAGFTATFEAIEK